ncbi:MAG: response regulator [Rhodospirillales bacterium]|jgi:DNA-binding response OmpR family regulator|nr:response regulator [Rhodospirillales bacterium]
MSAPPAILVVDDDAAVRDMLMEYLRGQGFRVIGADGPPAMWAALANEPVDLILLDRTMPSGDGLALLPDLRRRTAAGIIMLTALDADTEKVRGLEGGADDYITKPFVWAELTARMRAVLRRTGASGRPSPAAEASEGAGVASPPIAVLCADVAGYVRLMQQDETATLEAWWAHRARIIDPAIAAHAGRTVKFMGDGFLAEFPDAKDAIRCATTIQRGMSAMEARRPEDRRLRFRIGVHWGPVVRKGDDIYGMTVNVATRLQQEAAAGGLCYSQAVADRLQAEDIAAPVMDCGLRHLKHVEEPVRMFAIDADALLADRPPGAGGDPPDGAAQR